MASITFERTDGNLGRLPASEDSFSALLVVCHSDFLSANKQFEFTSKKQAYEKLELEGTFFEEDGDIDEFIFYQISEFFRIQPNARLLVRFSVPSFSDNVFADEIVNMQRDVFGQIRQIGVFIIPDTLGVEGTFGDGTPYATYMQPMQSLQDAAIQARTENFPLSVLYAGKTSNVTVLSNLFGQREEMSFDNVSLVIGGETENNLLQNQTSYVGTHASLGAALGTVSKAKVHENIGWVERFNTGINEAALFINNQTIKISTLSEVDLEALTQGGYIFPRKYTGLSGTYWNDSPTLTALTSDFAYIENNRTLDKAIRQTRILLLPSLNSPIYLNADGTLTAKDISRLSVISRKALEQMQRDGEVSNFSIFIDPTQNVLSTSEIEIEMEVQPVGVARKLNVKIGFAANVA